MFKRGDIAIVTSDSYGHSYYNKEVMIIDTDPFLPRVKVIEGGEFVYIYNKDLILLSDDGQLVFTIFDYHELEYEVSDVTDQTEGFILETILKNALTIKDRMIDRALETNDKKMFKYATSGALDFKDGDW